MTVEELLHDAEHADGGVMMARLMADHDSIAVLEAKRDKCIADALALDPSMQDEAWSECDADIRLMAKERVK